MIEKKTVSQCISSDYCRGWNDAVEAMPGWVSVKDRLPEKSLHEDGNLINYMCYMPEYGVDIANYVPPAGVWVCMGIPAKVTHWMPLPEPPKEDEGC